MKNSLKLLFFLVCTWNVDILNGDVSDHFKKAFHKSAVYSMRNIDYIYMINLDQRPEKFKMSLDQLTPYGIYPYRFSAVNGWELSIEEINDVGVKFSPEMEGGFMATSYHSDGHFQPSHEYVLNYGQTYFCHCMARGTIGIALSHISVLQDAFDSGFETIWVMEDDIDVKRDPNILSDLIDRLDQLVGKENWDILFTDRDIRDAHGEYVPCHGAAKRPDCPINLFCNDYYARRAINDEFWQIGSRFGAHSMIVRRSGMKKLLQFYKAHQIFLPYDMDFIIPPGIKLFAIWEDVVSNLPRALSDNGGANYLKSSN